MNRQVHMLRVAPIVAGMVWMGGSVGTACAQFTAPDATRPASAPAPQGQGNWWDTPTAPPPAGHQSLFRHDSYGSGDYPAPEMRDWVVANAMAARSRAMLSRAESELNITIRRVQQRFEHSEDYLKVAQADKQTYNDYLAARQKAINSLSTDPKYHAILQLRDDMGEKIAARRGARATATDIDVWLVSRGFERSKLTGGQMQTLKSVFEAEQEKSTDGPISRDEILAMATLKMQYAADARAIEVAALSQDENLKAAREKMVDAARKLNEMKAQFDYAIGDNPEVLMARRNLADARVAVIESCTLAYGASLSSNYALNYSYYLHRNDNGGQYGPNGNYGSYSSPYWGR